MKEMNRLLDANINRVSEGIRVIEDVARFVYNQKVPKFRKARISRVKRCGIALRAVEPVLADGP